MSQSPTNENVHPASLLLPWYLSGTLSEAERQEVNAHLDHCQTCQHELEEVRQLGQDVTTSFAELPGPSPQVFERVKARIQQEALKPQTHQSVEEKGWQKWLLAIEDGIQALFAPRWVPSLALVLLVGQTTFLLFMSSDLSIGPNQRPGMATGPVVERGVPMAPATPPVTTINVRFQASATEEQLRTVIQDIDGQIIKGPSPQGIYTIEVPGGNMSALDQTLQLLVENSGVVKTAQRVRP